MIKALTVVQLLLILVAIAWIGTGVFLVVWFAIRAACGRAGLGRRYQILISCGLFGIPFLVWLVASLDRLDALERTCRDELVKAPRMEGTTHLGIGEHYDYWTKTISG